jgi:hypothetical protein
MQFNTAGLSTGSSQDTLQKTVKKNVGNLVRLASLHAT